MPEGVDPLSPVESPNEPEESTTEAIEEAPASDAAFAAKKKKLLLMILGGAGIFFMFYIFFAFYLMVSLPSPDGGGQGLKAFGNLFYGAVSALSLSLLALIALRMIKSGAEPADLQRALMRPGILTLIIIMVAVMVFGSINRSVPIPVDIIEPEDTQGLTAPVTVTFGVHSMQDILKKQGLSAKKYKWDFNGDGKADADTKEKEVTTVYERKGTFFPNVKVLLSNGKTQTARTRISIPNIMISISPEDPIINEDITFDATYLAQDPQNVEVLLWDFNGDGTAEIQSAAAVDGLTSVHSFSEIGTHQSRVTIKYKGGLQEVYTRPINVEESREQPFEISMEIEGELTGTAPLGIIFKAKTEEAIEAKDISWEFLETGSSNARKEEDSGERISHIFSKKGDYRVTLKVTDKIGRIARTSTEVNVMEPLSLNDVVITGSPKPSNKIVEGREPLEVELDASTKTPLITFKWEQEGASRVFSSEDTYHARYQKEGSYPVVLIASDAEGRIQKFPMEIKVLPPKSRVTFSALPSTGIAPLSVNFDASQSFIPDARITGFAWLFGDEQKLQSEPQLLGARASHRYEEEGTYTVVVKALTEEGGSYEANKVIVVRSPILDACFFPSRSIGEAPLEVRLNAGCSTGNISTYSWTFGDGEKESSSGSILDHTFTVPGTYMTTLEVNDAQGSFSQTTSEIIVK
ncbi:PKD domain-containing protein [Candidatus Peribacteria bacterium]|jgi:PKD repeat protein|nr:PKD domain-containing protein [Candidatus Peribacteria bacterium]MBT4020766.1 PKD domain-containing protein [Candidatus Peribacteria bacterium]MBT4241046.1 PKD domain-containing protein [Candidatus Peribacteria bacterium]MBT4474455.1 PKD domain-containing protein [Candidatus Peribacteria bacterium]